MFAPTYEFVFLTLFYRDGVSFFCTHAIAFITKHLAIRLHFRPLDCLLPYQLNLHTVIDFLPADKGDFSPHRTFCLVRFYGQLLACG